VQVVQREQARAAIAAGTYRAYATAKLEAIDRHEHSGYRLGRGAVEASA